MRLTLILMLALTLMLAACNSAPAAEEPPAPTPTSEAAPPPAEEGQVDIRGIVSNVRISTEPDPAFPLATFDLDGSAEEEALPYTQAVVSITDETTIVTASGEAAGIPDLRDGTRVEVRFAGPVMESFPVQATAAHITILP